MKKNMSALYSTCKDMETGGTLRYRHKYIDIDVENGGTLRSVGDLGGR